MPVKHKAHSFNLNGRSTISANSIQTPKKMEGKYKYTAIPAANPVLKMTPLDLSLL